MSIVERISENDAELKDLRLTEVPSAYAKSVAELAEGFENNTVIKFIRMDRDFLPNMSAKDSALLFSSLGKLPNLKDAYIWHASMPVRVFADFIKSSKSLEKIHIGVMDLVGNFEDFEVLEQALMHHPTLQVFNLTDFSFNDDHVTVDGLVESLATIPNLRSVSLEVTHQKRSSLVGSAKAVQHVKMSIHGTSLCKLCSSPSLEKLKLSRLSFSDKDIYDISCTIEGGKLKSLALPHCQVTDQACSKLAAAIADSKTLEEVDLSCNKLSDEGCIALASVMKGNKSVKCLRLWGNVKITNAGFDALNEMMEENCTLERIPLMTPFLRKNQNIDTNKTVRTSTNMAA